MPGKVLGKYLLDIFFSNDNYIYFKFPVAEKYSSYLHHYVNVDINDEIISYNDFYLTLLDSYKTAIESKKEDVKIRFDIFFELDCENYSGLERNGVGYLYLHFDLKNVYYALKEYVDQDLKAPQGIQQDNKTNKNKKSKNNINNSLKKLGVNLEFGVSEDKNIASTILGIAIKNKENNNWYIFDEKSNTMKNMANIKIGDFPILMIPTKDLKIGELIKKDNKYFYVKEITNNNTYIFINAETGEIVETLKEESFILGFTFFTKIVSVYPKSLIDKNSNENISDNIVAAMMMLSLNNLSLNGLDSFIPYLILQNENSSDFAQIIPFITSSESNDEKNDIWLIYTLYRLLNTSLNKDKPNLKYKECDMCKLLIPEDSNFCPKCGNKLNKNTICINCKNEIANSDNFCKHCGASVPL